MATWLKVSPHEQTAHRSPHETTSYSVLALLLFAVGLALSFYTVNAADLSWSRPLPAEGSVGITGVMPGKPPTIGATINSPTDGQRFTTSPIEVVGTCPPGILVEIFRNDIFAGSTICGDDGKYKITIDLLSGANTFTARVYDALNQAGPDSKSITVYFDFIAAQAAPGRGLDFGGNEMIVQTDAVFRGAFPGKEMTVPVSIIGGVPPYAVNIQWGDLKNSLHSRADNQPFNSSHTYAKPGIYQLAMQATDSHGRVAFITVAAIVNGQPEPVAITGANTPSSLATHLMALWPLYTAAVAMVISFWLGEKRQKHALAAHGQLLTP